MSQYVMQLTKYIVQCNKYWEKETDNKIANIIRYYEKDYNR